MPSKYPVCTSEEILKVLMKAGFIVVSQKGSHIKMKDSQGTVIVPIHNKDIKIGTLKSILEQANMSVEEFKYYLTNL